ncbi:MAG: putative molybdenum carrier protein [Syntrophales bacterium]
MQISKIISGGQTGSDRAALDFAIEYNIPHGGDPTTEILNVIKKENIDLVFFASSSGKSHGTLPFRPQ